MFPSDEWQTRSAAEAGLDRAQLDEIERLLGGRGCVIRDGWVVKSWGEQDRVEDWASSAKPVLSTLLFFAIEEGLVRDVDQPIVEFGWDLRPKDHGITFRHLGAMMSGYARPEGPGEAWAYNDFAVQLYQKTLFDKVFKADPASVAHDPRRFGAIGLQDGLRFDEERRRMKASVRDFARIAWLWMNRGRWGDREVLPRWYFDEYMRPQTPKDLKSSTQAETDDYLGIGTYGGGSAHFAKCGAGTYGFNWWFNETGNLHPDERLWPDAPPDTYMSIGARGNNTATMPGLGLLLVSQDGNWGEHEPGRETTFNKVLRLLARSAGYRPGRAELAGALRKWHPLTLSFKGPESAEPGDPNPFTDYRLDVEFTCGDVTYRVPGFYAADGNAAESSASAGPVWRAHFTPDRAGAWSYRASFRTGPDVALDSESKAGEPAGFDGDTGSCVVREADSSAPGFLAKGMLRYTGKRYLQFAETAEYYLKGGADSPENFLAFADFDDTPPSHRYEPHASDWRRGDPVWQGGKGRNLVGALNYLASKGMNNVYFLTMNVKGDGKDVWPWTSDTARLRFDCSKLDQWEIVFRHMDRLGILLHVVTQEQENDQLLDGGELGRERKLYYRELIARFAHHPALVWNLGEENTNTTAQLEAFAAYIRGVDPYDHPIVVHTFPKQYDQVYRPLLGNPNFEGPSLQLGDMKGAHDETLKWIRESELAGRPWFCCLDEIGPARVGVKPDADDPEHNDVRRFALWGNLMAGGSGCEWLFGYDYPHTDLDCEDWRSRDRMWDQTRFAIEFFQRHLPFTEMRAHDELVEGDGAWCFAKPGEVYAVYFPVDQGIKLRLAPGTFSLTWYNPRSGGELIPGAVLSGGDVVEIGNAPEDGGRDWVALVRKHEESPP